MDSIANTPQEMQEKVPDLIQNYIETAVSENGLLKDSTILLNQARLAKLLYEKKDYISVVR